MKISREKLAEWKELLKKSSADLIPDPNCSRCKGAGQEMEENHHSGNWEHVQCACLHSQQMERNSARRSLHLSMNMCDCEILEDLSA